MERPLIVTALAQELAHEPIPHDVPVVITGLGKLNAAISLMEAIHRHNPTIILNFGTAGRLKPDVSGLVEVADVMQHDMITDPLAPRGHTPFDETPVLLHSGNEGVRCASGDSFMTTFDPWLARNGVTIVDMELFALAKVCHHKGIAWRSFKFITDDTDENAGDEWSSRVHHGRDAFLTKLDEMF